VGSDAQQSLMRVLRLLEQEGGMAGLKPLDVFMAACMSVRLLNGTSDATISHRMIPKLPTPERSTC